MNGTNIMRKISWIVAACILALVAACGGGGGGGGGDDDAAAPPATNTPSVPTTSDSGIADASALPTASNAPNTVPIQVKTANQTRNFPTVSVTVCAPGTNAATQCATIDNVLLDSGSFGLRLFASAVPSATLATLTPQKSGNSPIAECALFADSNAWGTVRNADVKMSAEVAQNVPVHIWADSTLAADVPVTAPPACQINASLQQVSDLGANGILGVGVAPADCPGCARAASKLFYYTCSAGTCAPSLQPVLNQVGNPVSRFAQDNNGVIVEMAQVDDKGQDSASGTLVFGIDTQANNALNGSAATLLATDTSGDFLAVYKGASMNAFTDTGSNAFFFEDTSLPRSRTSGTFYAPDSTLALSVAVTPHGAAVNTPSNTINFNVANADDLFKANASAYNDLAGSIPGSFDLGMSFFYGRHVYYGISGLSSAGGGTGPYVAYRSQ